MISKQTSRCIFTVEIRDDPLVEKEYMFISESVEIISDLGTDPWGCLPHSLKTCSGAQAASNLSKVKLFLLFIKLQEYFFHLNLVLLY